VTVHRMQNWKLSLAVGVMGAVERNKTLSRNLGRLSKCAGGQGQSKWQWLYLSRNASHLVKSVARSSWSSMWSRH
jgi:hypothetical protein